MNDIIAVLSVIGFLIFCAIVSGLHERAELEKRKKSGRGSDGTFDDNIF